MEFLNESVYESPVGGDASGICDFSGDGWVLE